MPKTNKERSLDAVIASAQSKLERVDLAERLSLLSVSYTTQENGFEFYALGRKLILTKDLDICAADGKEYLGQVAKILLLHYLQHDAPVNPKEQLISFRDLPGGQFYWRPFAERSVAPLVGKIGNDVTLLKNALHRFSSEKVGYGDFAAKIHIIGTVYIVLVYWLGDDEFPPKADMLFDAAIGQVYNTDDVAALASYVCFEIRKK